FRPVKDLGAMEAPRSHAENCEWSTVQPYRFPGDSRITAEPLLPGAIAEHDVGIRSGADVLIGPVEPADCGLDPEDVKVVTRCQVTPNAMSAVAGFDPRYSDPKRRDAFECSGAIANVAVVR